MSNPSMETQVRELIELIRMKEEIDAEISAIQNDIKQVMGNEEILFAGVYKVLWKTYEITKFDSARFKKDHADLAAAYTKTTAARRFSIN